MLGWHDPRPLQQLLAPNVAKAFERHFGYTTAEQLLEHLPRGYAAHDVGLDAGGAEEGDIITCVGEVIDTQTRTDRRGNIIFTIFIADGSNITAATFFRARWVQRVLTVGVRGMFTGKLKFFRGQPQLQHPDFFLFAPAAPQADPTADLGTDDPRRNSSSNRAPDSLPRIAPAKRSASTGGLASVGEDVDEVQAILQRMDYIPVYPAKKQVPTWTILGAIQRVLDATDAIEDPLGPWAPSDMPSWDEAIRNIHGPDGRGPDPHLERLKYQEALGLALVMALRQADAAARRALPLQRPAQTPFATNTARDATWPTDTLIDHLPFALTEGQQRVIEEIRTDLCATHPMQRLLQGEVGSGKTMVALIAMLTAVEAGAQSAMLAPTEVLATQHYRSIVEALARAGLSTTVVLLTGSMSTSARKKALLDVVSGEADIVVGTHAIIQESVEFYRLGLAVVDEQHRFGVEQRDALRSKGPDDTTPHLLVMTATPIPRTIAMTAFGDLAVSTLRELPGGRQPIESYVVPAAKPAWVQRMWRRLDEELHRGRQAFVVCPSIAGDCGVEAATEYLANGPLQHRRVALMHGQLPTEEKEQVMRAFARGDLDVLVSTTVIEVGIDVPNATCMVISQAERFGVSQLHQLRGRVGRGGNASICFLLTDAEAESASMERVQAVAATNNGFELADIDLEYRQEGNVLGAQQSGKSELKLLRLTADRAIIERAHADAAQVVRGDPALARRLASEVDVTAQDFLDKT